MVADVRHMSLEEEPQPQMYTASYDFGDESAAVRSALPPATVANEIKSALKSIDPNVAVTDMHTMGDLVSMASVRRRFQNSLLTVFAGIALVMAMVGLSGLMRFSVNRRTREVSIRMALGAARRVAAHPEKRLGAGVLGAGPRTRVHMDRNAAPQVISLWRGPA